MQKLISLFALLHSFSIYAAGVQNCHDLNGEEERAAYDLSELYGVTPLERLYERGEEKTYLRFAKWVKGFAEKITKPTEKEFAENIISEDARFEIFMIEELARAFRESIPEFEKVYDTAKGLEDAIGEYAYRYEIREIAERFQLPPNEMQVFRRNEGIAKEALLTFMRENGWMPDSSGRVPALRQILETVTDPKVVKKNATERRILLEYFANEAKDVAETRYDMNLLEDGIHEFRRDIRKMTILLTAKRGLMRLSLDHGLVRNRELADLMKNPDIADSKYVPEFAAYIDTAPVVLSRPYFLAIIKYVKEFGLIKDVGQQAEALIHVWMEMGVVKSQAEGQARYDQYARQQGWEPIDVHSRAHNLYNEMNRLGIMHGIYNEIRIAYD